jgi:type VI secretion system protein ImpE
MSAASNFFGQRPSTIMTAEQLVKNGQPSEAWTTLKQEIRDKPEDPKLRIFAFQLLSVLGQWERALTQLQLVAGMKAGGGEGAHLASVFGPAIQCEAFRSDVFAGKRSPIIFGEPEPWMGLLLQSQQLVGQGKFEAAEELRTRAFDEAPANPGQIGETPFAWMADADPRLGPMLEVILDGRYFWVPFCRIKVMAVQPPTDLRDLVWANTQFVWANGGEASGLVPVRYPGTETATDEGLRLARKTDWVEQPGGLTLGVGHRLLATDESELPLLEAKQIKFTTA